MLMKSPLHELKHNSENQKHNSPEHNINVNTKREKKCRVQTKILTEMKTTIPQKPRLEKWS